MVQRLFTFAALAGLSAAASVDLSGRAADPCTVIAGQKWVAPADVRACFKAQPVNQTEKANILEVTTKTLAFHTSTNYQRLAPFPFTLDIHEDLLGDLARYGREKQASDYDLHIQVSRAFKRLNDGHSSYINYCYDGAYATYLPTPLALLSDAKGNQAVHIAPEAFAVASAEFPDQIQVWQDALPGALKGKLESLSGAKVLAINGLDPWISVDANALISGSYQGFGTRQNLFFSTYAIGSAGLSYTLGQFAQQSLPLSDSATLTLQLVNSTKAVTVTLPYRSRISGALAFTDSASYRAKNCRAVAGTNGASYYDAAGAPGTDAPTFAAKKVVAAAGAQDPNERAKFAPSSASKERHLENVMYSDAPFADAAFPPALKPTVPAQNGSTGVAQFYLLKDGKTGVLALGSFSGISYSTFFPTLLNGLQNLKAKGATKLIVDISSNGGGYICVAHYLHRILAGPKSTTVPQAGLDTTARAGPLAKLITKRIAEGADPDNQLLYNGVNWRFDNNTQIPAGYDWLEPPVTKVINGVKDAFSQRLGDECQPFPFDAPATPIFDLKKVVIIGNSRCASSCALFTITMNKYEGVKVVVVGGKKTIPQQYAGTVGGQSTDFSTIDSEIKSVGLKNNSLAPPDFLTNSVQGLTWRLGFGVYNTREPEEWQNHQASDNLPLTADIVNKPYAIWTTVSKKYL